MLDAFLYILLLVFGILSVILGVIAPLFSFVAYCDLKDGRRLPVVVHLSGFFGLFTFAAVVTIIFKGPDIPLLLKVPGAVGLVLLWISALYLAVTRNRYK